MSKDEIVEVLRRSAPKVLTSGEIAVKLGVSKWSVCASLRSMRQGGLVGWADLGRKRVYWWHG